MVIFLVNDAHLNVHALQKAKNFSPSETKDVYILRKTENYHLGKAHYISPFLLYFQLKNHT